MKTQEILTIIGLACLGLCLLLCLLKMSMKDKKGQANCDKSCGMLFFAAAVLIGVSQLLKETSETYGGVYCHPGASQCPSDSSRCISNNPGTFPEANGNSCPAVDKFGKPIVPSVYDTCYHPDTNGCYSSGGGGGGSKCSRPPGIPVEGQKTAPLFAGNDQLCSDAMENLQPGWSAQCEKTDFIKRDNVGNKITCSSENDDCGSEFKCDGKYCASTGDGSYPKYTCAEGDVGGVAIKGSFGFCKTQTKYGGRCGISKNPSLS